MLVAGQRPGIRSALVIFLSFVSISPDVLDENLVLVVGHIPATNRKEWAEMYYYADSIQRHGPAGDKPNM